MFSEAPGYRSLDQTREVIRCLTIQYALWNFFESVLDVLMPFSVKDRKTRFATSRMVVVVF